MTNGTVLAVVLALGIAAPAQAAVFTLDSVAPAGSNFKFTYHGTIGPDEGVKSGNRLIIFDFDGYIPGSIFSPSLDLVGSTELTTATPFIIPGQTDDPLIPNLVFTYVGAPFHASGGPFAPFDFTGLGALSKYSITRLDAFTTFTIKNNPKKSVGTTIITLGEVDVPSVPEPSSWMMLIAGFGLIGAAVRRRRRAAIVAA